MASPNIKIKRSNVAGKVPHYPTTLDVGEFAINTADGKVFIAAGVGIGTTVREVGISTTQILASGIGTFKSLVVTDHSIVGISTGSGKVETAIDGGNQWHHVAFLDKQTGYQKVKSNGLTYNPSSGKLYAGIGSFGSLTTKGNVQFGDLTSTGTEVLFYGNNYDAKWDYDNNRLEFGDNAKATFGTGQDFRLYYDGSNAYLDNQGGNINIRSQADGTDDGGDIILQAKSGEYSLVCDDDGSVYLYHDGSNRLMTTDYGVGVTGIMYATGGGQFGGDVVFDNTTNAGNDLTWDMSDNALEFDDNVKATFGDSGDLTIKHDGTDNEIKSSNGKVVITTTAGNSDIEITPHGSGNVKLDSLSWPNSDGSANQSLVTDGSGTLSWSTVAGGTNTYTTKQTTTASQGQTAITVSANYTSGFVDVYLNGVRLISGTDYTETNTSTITLAEGATLGDEIETVAWKTLGDVVNIGTVNVIDNLSITGVTTGTGGFVGALTGNVTGNVIGNVTGNVAGNLLASFTQSENIIPSADSTYSLGTSSNRWANIHADAITLQTGGTLTGNVTGNVTGDVAGDLIGDVTGDVAGDLTGDVTGDLTGNVTGNCSGVAAEATALETTRYFSITGEVTALNTGFDGTGNTALNAVIEGNVVDADNLKVSNTTSASDGQALVKRSGNVGGMTWESISGGNLSIDSYENVFGGSDSGGNLSSDSSDNVLLGHDAGRDMTDGYENVCIGYRAGRGLTTTRRNTCVGSEAGRDFTAGDSTFIGWYAGQNAASNGNTCIGHMTGTEANGNDTAVGYSCGPTGSYSGDTNVCYGFAAGNGLRQSATRNTIIGPGAGRNASSGQVNIEGSHNIIIGDEASLSSTTVSNECVIGAIDGQSKAITKFRIPGINFVLKDNGGTPTEGHVLTVDSNGEASFAASSGGGGSTDMLEVMLFA